MTRADMIAPAEPLLRQQTAFQDVLIAEHPQYGRQLYIDGDLQISSVDRAYATAMVAPVLTTQPLRRVLIMGGGDGGVLSEVLRGADDAGQPLEQVKMVEIDRDVVALCQHHLPELCDQAYEDPRSHLVIGDAFAQLDQEHDLDAVLYDLTFDPVREDLARDDFVAQTVEKMADSVRPGGVVSMQCCGVGPTTDGDEVGHAALLETVLDATRDHFDQVIQQQVMIPSYEGLWTFIAARRPD